MTDIFDYAVKLLLLAGMYQTCGFFSQACGSSRLEPCTPLQCTGEDLCPPEGAPSCEKAAECVGALPLSRRANADAEDVKERLGRLKKKITEAAEKV